MEDLKIGKTSLKRALFSSTFLILLLAFEHGFEVLLSWFIAIIITFIISFIMIVVTIYQIVNSKSKEDFFKRYFPIYAMVFFISCLSLLIQNQSSKLRLQILTTAFLTAILSWVWLFKTENLKERT